LLALLRADLVERLHWLTENQLIDAIAVSQGTPGPFFTVSTFVGYLIAGWKGAALATVGMFLPAFVFVAVTARFLPRLRKSPMASAFLDGVNSSAVALMAFVGWQFARATFLNVPAIVIGMIAIVLLSRSKVNSRGWYWAGRQRGFCCGWRILCEKGTMYCAPKKHDNELSGEDDFAGGAGSEHVLVSLRSVFERQLFADNRAKRAIGETGSDPSQSLAPFRIRERP